MKNKERYANYIVEIATTGRNFALTKDRKRMAPCHDIGCYDCYFKSENYIVNTYNCATNKRMWANEEAELSQEEKVEKLEEYCEGRECMNCVICEAGVGGSCDFEQLSNIDKELGTDVINKMYKMIEG